MSDLFTAANKDRPRPLAALLRPERLDDIVGQAHILGPGKVLRRKVASGRVGTVILFGPPGVGKTTIARAIGAEIAKEFRTLHPAHNNVADIKALAKEAEAKPILVFVDEIHRFNAAQQDYLLSLTEDGVFDLVGATTGNPHFSLTKALVSRSTVLQLNPLTPADLQELVIRAVEHVRKGGVAVEITGTAVAQIAARAGGDGRAAVTAVEDLVAGAKPGDTAVVDDEAVEEVFAAARIPHDRMGDAHYDVVSAWIKAMRGSDPDGAILRLAQLIEGGEDPRFLARRLLIHASEDVGLADNTALHTAAAALMAVEHVGMPEAQIVLAHATLHIARSPKSNSACRAIGLALGHVKSQPLDVVPPYLRDGHYAGAKALGHVGYRFPHDEPSGWTDQDLAPGIEPGQFYQSDARDAPTFEKRADAYWAQVTGRQPPRRFSGD